MPGLIMRHGPSPGVRFHLQERLILGRHRKADVVIQDPGASRRHAAILVKPEGFHLVDLGSRNGTLLNGKPLLRESPLSSGDLIQIGSEVYEFVVEDEAPEGPPTAPLETEALKGRNTPQGRAPEPSADDSQKLPRELGKFILLEHLGRGGMGDVFRARERDGGPELAIKVIRSDIGKREAFLDFFHNREAVLAREIDHPNIIKVFEHGVTGGRHFLAMEHVAGESLLERCRRGPVPFDETLEILRQVACGLGAAHRRGVVHSDIKPGNILVLKKHSEKAEATGPPSTASSTLGEPVRVELEFPEGEQDLNLAADRYEDSLREEIRRRVGDPPQDLLLNPPYFQRPSEMKFLHHYWENLHESGGHFLLVEGDPGTGKDRLLSEFVKELGLAGSLPGTFLPTPAKLHELDGSRIEGIPLLYQKIFPDRAPPEHPTRECVGALIEAFRCDSMPAVVRILHLEQASPISCEFLLGLLKILPQAPILVLASLDTGGLEKNFLLRQLLEKEGGRVKELYLRPLTEYQIGRYLQEIFREPIRQERLAADLYRLTGGNFGRLFETLRSFFQRGILKIDGPAGRVIHQPSLREFELEEGKQLYEKYRRCGKMEQKILEQAAFIGPEFLFDTLLRFSEIDETALFFIVRDLYNQGFICEPSRTCYRFTNEAFCRYLSEMVSARERPRLHRKVAWLLDEAPKVASVELNWLRAYHWERAGEHGKAVRLLLEGTHLARNEYDIDRARDMYQEILRIYRSLASDETARKTVTDELRNWFRRDGNWYEILGSLGEKPVRPQVKITDFGISFKVQDGEEEIQIDRKVALGTPRYLAPERVGGGPGGPKSDIFALGIIAYEMIVGEPPFPGKKGSEVMRMNLSREIPDPKLPAGTPAEFLDLFRGMVEKDPDLRWDAERVLRTIEKMQFEMRMGDR